MVGTRVWLLALVFLCTLYSPDGSTKSVKFQTIKVSLDTEYGTLRTEIHFDGRDIELAMKVKKIVEQDLIKVINYFQYVPRDLVHFNIDPYLRLTNGNASPFPTNIINLYSFPADNSDHLIVMQDWLRGLVFHEYTHVTHLDQTSGYLEVGRKIFGSIAKIPAAIAPRWFTEGIAVWSESHLIEGGRLNNPLFRKELLIQFLSKTFCETIDCLDGPGVYPRGQLAYWAGAHFIEYIEEKKPGTVKCLVKDNSGNLPFVLNDSFRLCTGESAQSLFQEFRENLIKNQSQETVENSSWGEKLNNAFGSDDLQKGIFLDGNVLFKVERDRKSEALVSYDLKENVNMLISKFQYPISDIAGMTTVPNADIEQTDQGKFLIVSFNEDPHFRSSNRSWKLINTETLLIEANLPFKNDPSYVIGLGNNEYLTASDVDNKWIIEKQSIDIGTKKVVKTEVVHHFGHDVNLTYFKKVGHKIFLKLNRGDLGTVLYVSDLTLEKLLRIYESKKYFDIPLLNENLLIARSKDELKIIEIQESLKSIKVSDLAKDILERLTLLEFSNNRILVLENYFKTKEMELSDFQNYLKTKTSSPIEIITVAANSRDLTLPSSRENAAAESFPQLHHMLPHFWFLATGSSENLFSIGAMTQASDPMNLNVLNATVLMYPEENKMGGSIDYNHKFFNVSDLWSASAFYNQEYSKTDFSEKIIDKSEWSIGTEYTFLLKRWTVIPGVFFGQSRTNDFISNTKVDKVVSNTIVTYNAQSFDDFFQNLYFQTSFGNDMPEVGENYINTQSRLKAEGRFHERISGGLQTSYGKLIKNEIRGGTLYGGGTSNISNVRWHEFYGLPYSNAYGNEIFTFRLSLDFNFWYIYRGSGFFPVFLREAHLLMGSETMAADKIFLAEKRFDNKSIHSFFLGPVLKTTLFYYVPADIEMIFSTIKRPDSGSVNQVEFNLKASLF